MGSDFPVPRAQLPRVTVTPQEHAARRAQTQRILEKALEEYDHFRDVERSRVDLNRWKLVSTRENTKLYRERQVGSGVTNASAPTSDHSNSGGDNDDDDVADFDLSAMTMFNDTPAPDFKYRLKSMRMVGELAGFMESAVFAIVTKTQEELAMVQMYMQEGVADTQLLCMMEGPTAENPFHFLGYKWFVKRSLGGGRFVKHRDSVYLERIGITKNKRGEDIGYLLVESVDLPGFPEMPERNCVRSLQSIQYLVRQKSENVVEVFMTAVVEPSGRILRPLTTILTADTVLTVTRVMELAETRRLTKMIVTHRQARDDALYNRKHKGASCTLCHQRSKFYNTTTLLDCCICGQLVCSRCRCYKHVFVSDRLLGRLQRIDCCKTCLLAATRTRPTADKAPIHVSIASQFDFQPASSIINARPRSLSESSVGDAIPVRVHHPESDGSAVLLPRSASDDHVKPVSITHLPIGTSVRGVARRRDSALELAGDSSSNVSHIPRHTATVDPAPRATASSSQDDLYARMVELRRVAEDTYHTARQNHLFMEQGAPAPPALQQLEQQARRVPARHLY